MRVEIVLYEGFDDLDVVGPYEVLRIAEESGVPLAGGAWAARSQIGAWGEIQRGTLPRLLAGEYARGAQMAAVCTGTMLLAAAVITRGRPATTHRVALDALRAEGATVIDARVVDDGDLVTCGGVTSGIDMALWLVERHFGADLANVIAHRLEHDRSGDLHHRSAGEVR